MNKKYIEKMERGGGVVQGPVHKHLCLEDIFTMYMQLNNTYWLLYSVLVVCVHGVHVPHSE